GYCSRSFLTIPMRNHEHDIIGVLQLINTRDPQTGEIGAFSLQDQRLAESLASQAAVALTNRGLIDELKRLFDALVKLIATAIDEKSPHTGGHCKRVPALTMMLADAAHRTQDGPLREFALSEEDRYQLEVAGWLHDCGKITTPEHIMDKSTKLETIFDRIELVDTRFAVLKREAELARVREELEALRAGRAVDAEALDAACRERLAALDEQRAFLHRCNVGGESMAEADRARVRTIAEQHWRDADGHAQPLLSEAEAENLSIPKGTLTSEEREIVNQHIVATIKMLESLPFPKHLKNVPEYAAGHHERVDGKGYPRGLTGEQMSVPARVMAIADVFEALTDGGRPYKEGMPLSRALAILGEMKMERHIDPDLFDVFVKERVYLDYAKAYLNPAQIDIIDPKDIPGFPA
ncbi:MAG: HD domain-containing phosphohydrolase, partial [Gammaproteobacteria bacterium]